MKELSHGTKASVEEQLRRFSNNELFEQLSLENKALAKLGVQQSISSIAHGAITHGHLYEDRRSNDGGIKPTAMNFFMSLLYSQPDLLQLPKERLQQLGGVVSRIAMTTDILLERTTGFSWPENLCQSPQEQLNP